MEHSILFERARSDAVQSAAVTGPNGTVAHDRLKWLVHAGVRNVSGGDRINLSFSCRATGGDRALHRGNVNQTRVSSGALSAPTSPPWACINSLTIARPIPAPPWTRDRDFSPR